MIFRTFFIGNKHFFIILSGENMNLISNIGTILEQEPDVEVVF